MPKEKFKPVLLRLSLAGNLENHLCPSMGPNKGSVAMEFRAIFYSIGLLRGWIGLEYCTIREAKSCMKGCAAAGIVRKQANKDGVRAARDRAARSELLFI